MINISNLSFQYKKKVIFDNTSFDIGNGITYITGANGAGKTTLNKILYKEIGYEGSILIGGIELRNISTEVLRQKYISYLPQQLVGYESFSLKDLVTTFNFEHRKIDIYLKHFEFENLYEKSIKNLSGGEKQKALLIFTLLKNTPILILDEYENNLDNITINQLENLLLKESRCIIIISHRKLNTTCNVLKIIKDKVEITNITHDTETKLEEQKADDISVLKLYFSKNNGSRILFYIMIMVTIFLTTMSLCYSYSYYQRHTGIDASTGELYTDTAMLVVAPGIDQSVHDYKESLYTNETTYFFTQNDYESLENSELVSYIEITAPITANLMSMEYMGEVVVQTYMYNDIKIKLEYKTSNHSKRVVEYTAMEPNNVVYGEVPKDAKSNEVVIPLSYANSLTDNVESLIGQEIKVESKNSATGETSQLTFIVTGIYDDTITSNYDSVNPEENVAYIYGAFDLTNPTTIQNYPSYIIDNAQPEEAIIAMQNLFSNVEYRALQHGVVLDYESFTKYNQDGITAIYIEATTPEDVETITSIINEKYPYAGIYSKQSYNEGAPKSYFKGLKIETMKNIFIITICFLLISFLLLFNYYKLQIDFYKLIEFMGVKKNNILKIEIIEFCIVFMLGIISTIFAFYIMDVNIIENIIFFTTLVIYIIILYSLTIVCKNITRIKKNDKNL